MGKEKYRKTREDSISNMKAWHRTADPIMAVQKLKNGARLRRSIHNSKILDFSKENRGKEIETGETKQIKLVLKALETIMIDEKLKIHFWFQTIFMTPEVTKKIQDRNNVVLKKYKSRPSKHSLI